MLRTALRALEARFDGSPSSTSGSAPRPRGAEHVPLARRHRAPARDQGRLRARTGVDINIYPPERAAADLREALG